MSQLARARRHNRAAHNMGTWKAATGMAVVIAVAAACMMAMVVEIYHVELLPGGYSIFSLSPHVHSQALAAACAGFLPAFLCLQRLNLPSWSMAVRFTAPWLTIAAPAILTMCTQFRWFWGLCIAILFGAIAYRVMLGIATTAFASPRPTR